MRRLFMGLLVFWAVMGVAWSFIMIPAWLSQGSWGAGPVQFLVICGLFSLIGTPLVYVGGIVSYRYFSGRKETPYEASR